MLGVSRQSVYQLETAERNGSVTVRRLKSAADALECDLVILLVPRQPISELIEKRARTAARKQVDLTAHSMALEAQAIDENGIAELTADLARRMIESNDPRIWEST